MTSVNVYPDDIISTVADGQEDLSVECESDLTRFLPGLHGDHEEDHDDEDRSIVACLSPRDKYWSVYAIFYFLGITTLLPWNFFINADKYWMYKFRDVTNGTSNSSTITVWEEDNDHSGMHPVEGKTHFQASFTSYLAIASNVPSTICFLLNALVSRWISSNVRIVSSLVLTLALFVVSTVLVQIDTDQWQQLFFIITMVSVIFMNSFSSFFQSGLFSTVGRFPSEYTTAVLSGQALGGIFAAVANIFSIFLGADQVRSAFIYFVLGSTSLFFSVCVSIYLPKTLFYKFHAGDKGHHSYRWIENYPPEARIRPSVKKVKSWLSLFKIVWIQAISAMMIFVVTLAAFPTLVVLVISENTSTIWSAKYYVPVVSFLVFASGDYIGRIMCGALKLPNKDSAWTLVFAVLRLGFLPMIMLCNLQPRHNFPVIFSSDIEFAIISFLFGFTNGYLATIVFINAPLLVSREDQEDANGVVSTALGIGLSIGVTISYVLVLIL